MRTWLWHLATPAGSLDGSTEAADPREATSRAMTTVVATDKLVGQVYGVPIEVLYEAPGNGDDYFFFNQPGCLFAAWTQDAEARFLRDIAAATGRGLESIQEAGYPEAIPDYLKAGLTPRQVAHSILRAANW